MLLFDLLRGKYYFSKIKLFNVFELLYKVLGPRRLYNWFKASTCFHTYKNEDKKRLKIFLLTLVLFRLSDKIEKGL